MGEVRSRALHAPGRGSQDAAPRVKWGRLSGGYRDDRVPSANLARHLRARDLFPEDGTHRVRHGHRLRRTATEDSSSGAFECSLAQDRTNTQELTSPTTLSLPGPPTRYLRAGRD